MSLWALGILAAMAGGLLLSRVAHHRRWGSWERDRRRELEAYCMLELSLPLQGDPRKRTDRAKRVARLVTEQSVFAKSALFLQDHAGRLVCMGSCGMDDLSLEALDRWCERCLREEGMAPAQSKERLNESMLKSFSVEINSKEEAGGMHRAGCTTATLVPVRLQRGRLVGLLAVCGDRAVRLSGERGAEALAALELLAAKLARTIERAMLMDRLIQVERLAGAAQLVAGVAEALIDPLRSVRDRSELIAGTSTELRVREHAEAIVAEAAQMSETVALVCDAWRDREELVPVVAKSEAES